MSQFNNLSDVDHENLSILFEELSEAIQVVGKIMRHGLNSYNPLEPGPGQPTNRQLLERELGHVQHAQARLVRTDTLDQHAMNRSCIDKQESIKKYLHHSVK